MREILFRGKLISTGEWAYGNLNRTIKGTNIITPDEMLIGKYGAVIPETVGQYTSLTDKNGTKIFEGDIAYDRCHDEAGVIIFENCSFLYKNDKFCLELPLVRPRIDLKIIGNIHDNPELLKEGADNG